MMTRNPCLSKPKRLVLVMGMALGLALSACTALPKGRADLDVGLKQRGIASWYGSSFHGQATASRELYNMQALTGAHRTLPLGTVVRVTNVINGKQVQVRINDRGPYLKGRIADLSFGAAKALDMVDQGLAAVQLEVIASPAYWEGGRDAGDWQMFFSGRRIFLASQSTNLPAGGPAFPQEAREERRFRYLPRDLVLERRARREAAISPGDRGTDLPSRSLCCCKET